MVCGKTTAIFFLPNKGEGEGKGGQQRGEGIRAGRGGFP